MKSFVWTMLAVAVGILVYAQLTGRKIVVGPLAIGPLGTVPAEQASVYYGPEIDPITGAWTGPGAKAGTVQFNAQGN